MNETKVKPYIRVMLLVLALFLAGLFGWKLGSENMQHKWIEASNEAVPIVIDYVMETYREDALLVESHKDLIKAEGMLLFIQVIYMSIDPEAFWEYRERYGW